jgi:pimeloyl-ACP methyl ester carboxylesterase
MVEKLSIESIERARNAWRTKPRMRQRLARYHADADGAFRGWNDIWLHPAFRAWNIEAFLPRVACPVLAIQGHDDEYGTLEQLERIERAVPDVRRLHLQDCRHSPHRDQTDAVLAAIGRFVDRHAAT